MSSLLLWVGLTGILALSGLWASESSNIIFISQIIMCIGAAILIYEFIKTHNK